MMGHSIWYLIIQSDTVSKGVLVCLLGMSIACWTIFFFKLIVQRIKISHIKHALHSFSMAHTVHDLKTYAGMHIKTVVAYMINKNSEFLVLTRLEKQGIDTQLQYDIDALNDQIVDDVVQHEQSFVSILSTSAMVAPLLGLFGTVWGLVHAFLSIAQQRNADIATVAPGIAEALITTLAGLIVAIPAQIMYNILVARIRAFDGLVLRLADTMRFVFKRSLEK
jgi:biopolymer transport protein ExbB/TolQ